MSNCAIIDSSRRKCEQVLSDSTLNQSIRNVSLSRKNASHFVLAILSRILGKVARIRIHTPMNITTNGTIERENKISVETQMPAKGKIELNLEI